MKKSAVTVLCLLASVAAFAQSKDNESAAALAESKESEVEVMNAAMKYTFNETLPYVTGKIILHVQTVALPAPKAPGWDGPTRKDFAVRNSVSTMTTSLATFNEGSIADLSKFGAATSFDASSFMQTFGESAKALWISRPGFADDSHAFVVMRFLDPLKKGSLTMHNSLVRTGDGWRATCGGTV